MALSAIAEAELAMREDRKRLAAYDAAVADIRPHFNAWCRILEKAATAEVQVLDGDNDLDANVSYALHELTAMRRDLGALLAIDPPESNAA